MATQNPTTRVVFIAYDLHGSRRDYPSLYSAIQGYPHYNHCQASGWLVAGPGISARSVYEHLMSVVTPESALMCLDVIGSSVEGNLTDEDWEWIYRVMPDAA